MDVLRAININKSYGKDKFALKDVNFDLQKGEIHSLLGPNGAGKTTLIKVMATLLRKDSGSVNVLGFDLDTQENMIRQVLGYVGQDTERSAYARLTPIENLRFFGALRGMSKDEVDDRIGIFAESMAFEEHLQTQFMHLSGGQKQAVIIMRALLHSPPVVFLDEPTKGLDPIIAKRIRSFPMNYVKDEGHSMLMTSHILSEVDEMSDRVSLIHNGKIKISGTPDELKRQVGATDLIELERGPLSDALISSIQQLPVVTNTYEKEKGWISFGVTDLFDGTETILDILRTNKLHIGFRQSNVTLEDAFVHHIGVLEEAFER